jgi:hypothetical protein
MGSSYLLVAMDSSCKTYVKTDLASLHYVTFIEPLVVCPTEALSFELQLVYKQHHQQGDWRKNERLFHAPQRTLLCRLLGVKKLMNLNSNICHMKFSSSSQNYKVSDKMLVNNKYYHCKVMLIIFLLQTCILNIKKIKVIYPAISHGVLN